MIHLRYAALCGDCVVRVQIFDDALTVLQTPLSGAACRDVVKFSHVNVCCVLHFMHEVVVDCESVNAREVLAMLDALDGGAPVSPSAKKLLFDVSKSFAEMDFFQQQVCPLARPCAASLLVTRAVCCVLCGCCSDLGCSACCGHLARA